ncbi:MAG: TetR/AcrR family transcriptional regulator [Intrasporangium sp.]|uniref:TetR/AcrR family transcriptional regulator n=1 Tax=Intrasporangium sp. TaxID=1925024 RepID=UPI002649A414|nr:TetR/AcrR family transcriptional regulator [Intrasporangium sp.]MDN5798145.1 TetR/AcrR family transcriptional regulator [Intrasporangium sp.]
MPKIDAPTVAEHREMRRREVVTNARELLMREGPAGVTPAAVAKATGLARSSVYQYYPTTGALIGAAVEDLFALAQERVDAALTQAGDDTGARLTAYISTTLELAAQGHSPGRTMGMTGIPPKGVARLRELHDALAAPFVEIIGRYAAELPGADGRVLVGLASGTLNGAAMLVEHGAPLREVTAATVRYVSAALRPASPEANPARG